MREILRATCGVQNKGKDVESCVTVTLHYRSLDRSFFQPSVTLRDFHIRNVEMQVQFYESTLRERTYLLRRYIRMYQHLAEAKITISVSTFIVHEERKEIHLRLQLVLSPNLLHQ